MRSTCGSRPSTSCSRSRWADAHAPARHRARSPTSTPTGSLPEANVRALITREFGVEYSQASWFTTYRVHHRLAQRFREGPCFIVGDAAHIHSPVGAQGMNTGLQEAHNLACALADVLVRRHARRAASTGSRPSAVRSAGSSSRRPTGCSARSPRSRDSPGSCAVARCRSSRRSGCDCCRGLVGGRIFGYLSQTRIHYRMSPHESRRDHVVGRRLPWTGDNFDVLRSMTWQVHGYGVYAPEVHAIAESVGPRGSRVRARPARAARSRPRVPRAARRVRRGRGIRSRRARRAARLPRAARGLNASGCRVGAHATACASP